MKKIFTMLFILLLTVSFAYGQNQWTLVSSFPAPNPPANSLSVANPNIMWVVCTATGGAARVYKTTNAGLNWTLANGGLSSQDLYGVSALDASTCWIGTVGGSIYRTTNGGSNWSLQIAVSGSFINGIKMFNPNYGVYIGDPTGSGQPYQFRYTTNGGTNWTLSPSAPIAGSEWGVINAWDWTDSLHFWTGSVNTVPNSTTTKIYYTSTGFPGTWQNTLVTGTGGTQGLYYQAVAFVDNNNGLIGSSGSNIIKTTNGGLTFSNVTAPPILGTSFAVMNMTSVKSAGIIRMACDTGGGTILMRTSNLGTSWIQETLPPSAAVNIIADMEFLNEHLGFAVIGSATVPLGGFLKYGPSSSINPINSEVPDGFKLEQNYPNPFNPGTTIKFAVPKAQYVTLKVYNNLGKELDVLVSEFMAAGNYSVFYDAAKLPSGVYFYKITTDSFTDIKKMMLIK